MYLFNWHSSSWWCIMILSLVMKGSTVQKILSCQSLNNTTYDFRYYLRYCLLTFAPNASLTDRYMDSQAETNCKNTIFMLQFCPAGTIKSVLIGQQANNEYPETSRDLSCLYLKVEIQSPEQRTVASNLMPQSSFTCCTYTMNSACVWESVCRHNHTCTN